MLEWPGDVIEAERVAPYKQRIDEQSELITKLRTVVNAAYVWRAAEVHQAACRLGVRREEIANRGRVADTLRQLRIATDTLHKDKP